MAREGSDYNLLEDGGLYYPPFCLESSLLNHITDIKNVMKLK